MVNVFDLLAGRAAAVAHFPKRESTLIHFHTSSTKVKPHRFHNAFFSTQGCKGGGKKKEAKTQYRPKIYIAYLEKGTKITSL